MINESLLMLPLFLLIAVYLILGRVTLRGILEKEGRNPYSEDSSGSFAVRFTPSANITKLVFDASMPKANYPRALRAKIFAVRIIFAILPFLLVGTFIAMLVL